jgi:hypothetical protein
VKAGRPGPLDGESAALKAQPVVVSGVDADVAGPEANGAPESVFIP